MIPIGDHNNGTVSWREAGTGDAIVFLHPVVGTSHYWDAQLEDLSDQWRCVAWDSPGYGGSQPLSDSTVARTTERLIAFVDELELDRPHLVGLSLGGMQALCAAAQNPNRFGSIVLADTSAAFGGDSAAWLGEWLAPLGNGVSLDQLVADSIDAIVHEPLPPEIARSLRTQFEGVATSGFENASRYIAEHDVRADLRSITNDCLVIVGEQDHETPVAYSQELADALRSASLAILPDVGHLSSIEAPQAFNQLVRQFLSTPSSRGD